MSKCIEKDQLPRLKRDNGSLNLLPIPVARMSKVQLRESASSTNEISSFLPPLLRYEDRKFQPPQKPLDRDDEHHDLYEPQLQHGLQALLHPA